ncbi:MAG: hypothetical protein IPG78_11745 [Ignavibacteria bacterium]|nr:hypothetical protein [Ignavibacteria bacterium]
MTPADGTVVTDTTKFTYTAGDGEGIYNIIFKGSSGQLNWYVSKLGKITSVDNFTEEFFRSQKSFKTVSDVRNFRFK